MQAPSQNSDTRNLPIFKKCSATCSDSGSLFTSGIDERRFQELNQNLIFAGIVFGLFGTKQVYYDLKLKIQPNRFYLEEDACLLRSM